MKKYLLFLVATTTILLSGCNKLTPEAKKMIGDYYIPEISLGTPILRLNGDGSCTITAVKPNVLTYSVEGDWNVKNDSLLLNLNPDKITWEGDSSLIDNIPARKTYYVVSFNDITLRLEREGLIYDLHRRVNTQD
ncbi:MAG: membrane lipoprotein lipid attachment site-containing protein [Muribaculaceae bacterium]|nr:membrane lipoprotein lipid attachment site-containing protein [Muribaculaceae bacterium]